MSIKQNEFNFNSIILKELENLTFIIAGRKFVEKKIE